MRLIHLEVSYILKPREYETWKIHILETTNPEPHLTSSRVKHKTHADAGK